MYLLLFHVLTFTIYVLILNIYTCYSIWMFKGAIVE